MKIISKVYGPAGERSMKLFNCISIVYRKAKISNHGVGNRFLNVSHRCEIYCHGDHCVVEFGTQIGYFNGRIYIGDPIHNAEHSCVYAGNPAKIVKRGIDRNALPVH